MEYLLIYAIGAIITFCLIYPAWFAYFQRRWPTLADIEYSRDKRAAFLIGAFGALVWPFGLPAWLLMVIIVWGIRGHSIYRHGFKWR